MNFIELRQRGRTYLASYQLLWKFSGSLIGRKVCFLGPFKLNKKIIIRAINDLMLSHP